MYRTLVTVLAICGSIGAQTPVIGGTCKLGTADVQIGGKQTQFFLKCETTADSSQGEGVWVVKSRSAASSQPPPENTQPQQHPKARKPASPNICEQDNSARDGDSCAVSATCLQAHPDVPSSYLQCDQGSMRWIRKSCQEGYIFNFEQQTCIVPKRMSSLSRQKTIIKRQNYVDEFVEGSPRGCNKCAAACKSNNDCPTAFVCEHECCRLAECPRNGGLVRFTCTSPYHCGSSEVCLFGGCCPTDTAFVEESRKCEIDNRVDACDIENTCPETSECIDGVCCKLPPMARCANGLMALSIPPTCKLTADCPISSRCEYGKCCPLEHDTLDAPSPPSLSPPGISLEKSSCMSSMKCDAKTLCPPEFTCSLAGRCCQLDEKCTDGTAPETECDETHSCPSSAQQCVRVGKKTMACCATVGQQSNNGLVCTFASCSNSNPCSVGTCNNGYCCSSSSGSSSGTQAFIQEHNDFPIGPPGYGFPEHLAKLDEVLIKGSGDGTTCAAGFESVVVCSPTGDCPVGLHCDNAAQLCCPLLLPLIDAPLKRKRKRNQRRISPSSNNNNNCVGCGSQNSPQIITIPQNSCPGGGYSVGSCSTGYCATGYTCVQNQCCPSYNSPPKISVYTCSTGASPVGACMSGRCASGYQCQNNVCCPQQTTSNPFVCPDGTQAAGGCVNGQCGAGYTCSNGLCCAGTTNAVRCLDGSEAVGACIPSCTGDGCGGVQVTYYCGSGYTCTTGNICCAVNSCPNGGEVLGPAINGLCPTGYALQGNVCCSQAAKCDDGSEPTKAINNVCIPGYKLVEDGMCCPGAETSCTADLASGTCTGTGFNGGCQPGYVCDTANGHCCPYVTYEDENCQLGPVFNGACPPSSTAVEIQPEPVCVDLQCTIGVCPETEQIGECQDGECPPGYSCYAPANICCKATTFRKRLNQRGQRLPAYGQPLNSFMPPRALASTCAGGQPSAGPCINGLCGIGYECQLGKCCPESAEPQFQSKCANGETAVSGCFTDGTCGTGYQCVQNLCCPPSSRRPSHLVGKTMPIGARCMFDGECVGNSDGLSMCDAGVCQCSPIAYTQGIACVRRKSFQMNDEPLVDGKLETADKQLASNKVTAEATI